MSGLYENTYRIDSARLASWDYARSGIYFVTICTQNRAHFFGEMIAMPMPGGGAMHRMPGIRRDAMHRVSTDGDDDAARRVHADGDGAVRRTPAEGRDAMHRVSTNGDDDAARRVHADGDGAVRRTPAEGRDAMHRVSTNDGDDAARRVHTDGGYAALRPTEIGRIAWEEWFKTPGLRPDMNLQLGEFIVMPNHIHGIIFIGANPYNTSRPDGQTGTDGSALNAFAPQSKNLASIIRGYKSAVTTYARRHQIPFGWQPRFYDRIIRSADELQRVSSYILNNPARWHKDPLFAP